MTITRKGVPEVGSLEWLAAQPPYVPKEKRPQPVDLPAPELNTARHVAYLRPREYDEATGGGRYAQNKEQE